MTLEDALMTAEETDEYEKALTTRDEWKEAAIALATEVRRLSQGKEVKP